MEIPLVKINISTKQKHAKGLSFEILPNICMECITPIGALCAKPFLWKNPQKIIDLV